MVWARVDPSSALQIENCNLGPLSDIEVITDSKLPIQFQCFGAHPLSLAFIAFGEALIGHGVQASQLGPDQVEIARLGAIHQILLIPFDILEDESR